MDQTALFKLSYGLYVAGVKTEQGFGGCIVDALMQVTSDMPPLVLLGSMKNTQTNRCIRQHGAFTISVLAADVDPFVIANFGFQSSAKADKWANVPHEMHEGLPVLSKGAVSYLHCKLLDSRELSTHTLYTCEVTDAWHGESGDPLLYGDYQKHMKQATMEAFKAYQAQGKPPRREPAAAQWVCTICGHVYDGEVPFEELPDDWRCPRCGVPKAMFEKR